MFIQLVLPLVLLITSTSAVPAKKCAPDQWSASIVGSISQLQGGNVTTMTTRGRAAADYNRQIEAELQNITVSGYTVTVHTIIDYKQLKFYSIQLESKHCEVGDLPSGSKLIRPCEGDERVVDSLTIGGKMAYALEAAYGNYSAYTTVFGDNFTPVTKTIQQVYKGMPQMVTYQYGNVSDMVRERIFEIPSYCQKSTPSKRVCGPDQFEADGVGRLGQVVEKAGMAFGIHMRTSWDYTNKREAAVSKVSGSFGTFHTKTITKWNERKLYTIDLDKKTCTVIPTPVPKMPVICSDSDKLTRIDSLKVDGKMADVYKYYQGHIAVTMTAFRDNMNIISLVTEQTYDHMPQMLALQYGNYTLGIKDSSVFNLPDYCPKADATIG